MKDRLKFENTVLSNGIRVYEYPTDDPFALIRVIFPLGHLHNTNGIYPGSFHFLEHMMFHGSKFFPNGNEFDKIVEENGGSFSAVTGPYTTCYSVETSTERFAENFSGLIDHLLNPIFSQLDIDVEVGVISSELKRKEYWYPGKNAIGKYMHSKWLKFYNVDLYTSLGREEDLKKIIPEYLYGIHKHYFNSDIKVIIAGGYNRDIVKNKLEQIPTSKQILSEIPHEPEWINRKFHLAKIEGTERFLYNIGTFTETGDFTKSLMLSLVLHYLTNTTNGPLYMWLRIENGYLYDVNYNLSIEKDYMYANIELPLNSIELVESVRGELKGKIYDGLNNKILVEKYLKMNQGSRVFHLQRIIDKVTYLQKLLYLYNHNYTETELIEMEDSFTNSKSFVDFFENFLSENLIGECVIAPIK